MEQNPPAGPLRTLGALLRAALYAVTFQPDNEPGTRKPRRGDIVISKPPREVAGRAPELTRPGPLGL